MPDEVEFFKQIKCPVVMTNVTLKVNKENEKRIRFDFSLPLTAKIVASAPEDVKDAFYSLAKDGGHLTSSEISTEFEGVVVSFFDTKDTKAPALELGNSQIRQLVVARPQTKKELDDGDIRLAFHINAPGSKDAWNWGYRARGTELCAVFEEMQPVFPQFKEANPDGDGQGILEMEKSDPIPTVPAKAEFGGGTKFEVPKPSNRDASKVKPRTPAKKKSSTKKSK